ncbi:MAG TPA: hypothetical protein VHP11_11015, partial [Tepidisphaeraceae bacterium]|nr:hypothetical protein [Tepidisphaeraceae bacterium]
FTIPLGGLSMAVSMSSPLCSHKELAPFLHLAIASELALLDRDEHRKDANAITSGLVPDRRLFWPPTLSSGLINFLDKLNKCAIFR